jgi:hypothetical protein
MHRLALQRRLSSGCLIPATRANRVQQTRDDEQIQVCRSSALHRDELRRMPEAIDCGSPAMWRLPSLPMLRA